MKLNMSIGENMKKKKIILIFFIAVSVFFCGCSNSDNYKKMKESQNDVITILKSENEFNMENSGISKLRERELNEYKVQKFNIVDCEKPSGISCFNNGILVSDKNNDCIIKYDTNGKELCRKGDTGSGNGEFISPEKLVSYNDEVYVVDKGNNRIQVLNQELKYIKSISLKDLMPQIQKDSNSSIAVSSKGVFTSGCSTEDSTIVNYDKEQQHEVGRNFIGSLFEYNDDIFAVNSMMLYYDSQQDMISARTGDNYLLKVFGRNIKKICDLPSGMNIGSFIIDKDGIVAVSSSGVSIYRFNMKGEYLGTICKIEDLKNEIPEEVQISSDSIGTYYVLLPKKKQIIKCIKKQ